MHPFSKRHSETVGSLGEDRLIQSIRQWLGPVSPPAPLGIGDDCAVLPASRTTARNQAITVDPVIYGRHFDDTISPRDVGAKLLKRNLSDIAAMGATPTAAVLALTLGSNVKTKWLEQFYRGLAACARTYKLHIIGGDVAQADGVLAASLTLLGHATAPRMLLRKGARLGDWIYVTGSLGGSLLGKHYRFVPRLAEGAWLAAQPEPRSMMDVSDGLAKDLHALTPKGARPDLKANAIPASAAARRMAKTDKRTLIDHALSDGEDHELVFTVAKNADKHGFERRWKKRFPKVPLHCIGRFVRAAAPLSPDSVDLSAYHGYEHLTR